MVVKTTIIILYSRKFSWEKIFANFGNWRVFMKIFSAKIEGHSWFSAGFQQFAKIYSQILTFKQFAKFLP